MVVGGECKDHIAKSGVTIEAAAKHAQTTADSMLLLTSMAPMRTYYH